MGSMTLDQALMVGELLLLAWVVVQGEYVRYYEREVHRMTRDRFEERKKWRLEKQEQARKKSEPKTSDSGANSVSLSPTENSEPKTKTTSAKSVAGRSTPSDPLV
jgi:hypothetical protein